MIYEFIIPEQKLETDMLKAQELTVILTKAGINHKVRRVSKHG